VRIDLTRVVKLGLFFCLALTFYKGVAKIPEVYTLLDPARFFRGMINDGENSLIMKERHFDFNFQTGRAVALRLEEMKARGENPPEDVLPNRARVELAHRKTLAKDERNADYVLLADEKLQRAKRLQAQGWTMGWTGADPAAPVSQSRAWEGRALNGREETAAKAGENARNGLTGGASSGAGAGAPSAAGGGEAFKGGGAPAASPQASSARTGGGQGGGAK
jgi:hypothetical protein